MKSSAKFTQFVVRIGYVGLTAALFLVPYFLGKGSIEQYNSYGNAFNGVWITAPFYCVAPAGYIALACIDVIMQNVKNGAKKISYASSIAVSEIKESMRKIYAERLSTYSSISLREKTGVDLIEKLTGKKASLVCDPTLLLTRDEWDSFISPPTIKIATPYILAYILSYSYNPYPEVFSLLKDLGKKTGLPVVFLSLPPREAFHAFSSTKIASASPSDFINLIKNASYVFTTSFHGSIFSLIYNRPLVCYTNPNDSRLTDLLETMGCANCAVPFGSKSLPPDIQIDFSVVNEQMKKIRKESYSYLKNALE